MSVLRRSAAVGVVAAVVVAAVALSGPASAVGAAGRHATEAPPQSGRNLERPPTWMSRYDDAAAGERVHLVMRPGWHINPGPAGIFWDGGRFAEGNYSISSKIFLFPAGTGDPPARVDEPYGVLFAGTDLDAAQPRYMSFMLRNDGTFRVARHAAGGTEAVIGWSAHDAVATWAEGDQGTAENLLAIDVAEETVTFWVNEQQVAALPRGDVATAGIVGLRAGAGVSLHITDLTIGPNRR